MSYNPLFLSFSLHILLYSSCHGLSMCILCFRGIFSCRPPYPWPESGPYLDHKSLCFCPLKQHVCNQLLADVSVPYRLCRPICPLGMRKSKGNHQREMYLLLMIDKAGLVLADHKAGCRVTRSGDVELVKAWQCPSRGKGHAYGKLCSLEQNSWWG